MSPLAGAVVEDDNESFASDDECWDAGDEAPIDFDNKYQLGTKPAW